MCKSLNKVSIHINSHVAFAMALYSASTEDLEIVCYFFDFQETKESPMKTRITVIDLLVFGHAAQSESANPFKVMEVEAEKK